MTDPNRFKLNRGPLFRENKKTNEKAPDWKGHIELDAALLQKLVQLYKDRKPIKLEVSGWDSTSNKGASYIGLQVKEPYERAESREQAPPRRAEPAPRQHVSSRRHDPLADDIPF